MKEIISRASGMVFSRETYRRAVRLRCIEKVWFNFFQMIFFFLDCVMVECLRFHETVVSISPPSNDNGGCPESHGRWDTLARANFR